MPVVTLFLLHGFPVSSLAQVRDYWSPLVPLPRIRHHSDEMETMILPLEDGKNISNFRTGSSGKRECYRSASLRRISDPLYRCTLSLAWLKRCTTLTLPHLLYHWCGPASVQSNGLHTIKPKTSTHVPWESSGAGRIRAMIGYSGEPDRLPIFLAPIVSSPCCRLLSGTSVYLVFARPYRRRRLVHVA